MKNVKECLLVLKDDCDSMISSLVKEKKNAWNTKDVDNWVSMAEVVNLIADKLGLDLTEGK
jgi:hypothetical protein